MSVCFIMLPLWKNNWIVEMKRIFIVLVAALFAFSSCDVLAGLSGGGDDVEQPGGDAEEPGDGEESGDGQDKPVVSVDVLSRKLTRILVPGGSQDDYTEISFTYDDSGRLVKMKECSYRGDLNGDGMIDEDDIRVAESIYSYSDDAVTVVKNETDQEGYTTVFTLQDGKVVRSENDYEKFNYIYDENHYLVGYDRDASAYGVLCAAKLGVKDGTVVDFSCEVEFIEEKETDRNEGSLVPGKHENNLNIDLYPIFVYMGETLYSEFLPVFMVSGISRYKYLPERVPYKCSYVSEDGSGSEEREENYQYEMDGDYIKKVVYTTKYSEDNTETVVYEFTYEE